MRLENVFLTKDKKLGMQFMEHTNGRITSQMTVWFDADNCMRTSKHKTTEEDQAFCVDFFKQNLHRYKISS
jgi:hypothetical protein